MHVGVGRKIAARNVDAERQARLHLAGVGGVAIDRQGDGVANLDVAAHRAGHRNRTASLRRVDDVVGRDGVEDDARHRRHRVDRVSLVVGRRAGVARRVGRVHAGMHVGVGRKIAARNVDAERQASLHLAGVGGVAIDRQGDGVANLHLAAHRAGHRNRTASLRRVDDVVGRDGVEGNARHRRQRVHYLHRQGSRRVRGDGRVEGDASRHAHGQNALEVCHRRHHQRVGVAIDRRERTLGSVDNRDVGCVKAGHRLAELESIENAAAGDVSRTSLVVGDRDGRGPLQG